MRILALFGLFACLLQARSIRLESGKFTVITDANERIARTVLRQVDLTARIFAGSSKDRALPLPVSIFVLNSEARFGALRSGEATRGFYQSSADRDYIVIDAHASELDRIVNHEFVHLVLNHTSAR